MLVLRWLFERVFLLAFEFDFVAGDVVFVWLAVDVGYAGGGFPVCAFWDGAFGFAVFVGHFGV